MSNPAVSSHPRADIHPYDALTAAGMDGLVHVPSIRGADLVMGAKLRVGSGLFPDLSGLFELTAQLFIK